MTAADARQPSTAPSRRCSRCRTPTAGGRASCETNVTMDAEDLLLREFLGIRDRRRPTRAAAAGSAASSATDGTWATFYGGPGRPLDHDRGVRRAAARRRRRRTPRTCARRRLRPRRSGGIERARVFTRIWLALFGWWTWDDLPALPPEVILLPAWFPLNIYDFACWARQTIVPLTVVAAHRPVRPLPFALDELRTGARAADPPRPLRTVESGGASSGSTARCTATSGARSRRLRRRRCGAAERWILAAPGGRRLLGRHPAALGVLAARAAPARLPARPPGDARRPRRRSTASRSWRRATARRLLEACQSPVWDTALAVDRARRRGRAAPTTRRCVKAADWMLGEEIARPRRLGRAPAPTSPPGGWAFEFAQRQLPRHRRHRRGRPRAAPGPPPRPGSGVEAADRPRRCAGPSACSAQDGGVGRLRRRQHQPRCPTGCRSATSARSSTRRRPTSPRTWSRCSPLEGRAHDRRTPARRRVAARRTGARRLVVRPLGRQPRLRHRVASCPALVAAGVPADAPRDPARRALARAAPERRRRLGRGPALLPRPARGAGRGASTASQTAWALLALLAARRAATPAVERGVAWLVETQRPDGTWDEPYFTGTGFPGDFYINYHLYRQVLPAHGARPLPRRRRAR